MPKVNLENLCPKWARIYAQSEPLAYDTPDVKIHHRCLFQAVPWMLCLLCSTLGITWRCLHMYIIYTYANIRIYIHICLCIVSTDDCQTRSWIWILRYCGKPFVPFVASHFRDTEVSVAASAPAKHGQWPCSCACWPAPTACDPTCFGGFFFTRKKKKKTCQVRVKPWEDGDFTTKNQIWILYIFMHRW